MGDEFKAWVVRAQRVEHTNGLPLSGVSVGVKDIIDVAGFPTAYGVDFVTTHPHVDAWCVSALRGAGAAVAGKTHTTPFAFRDPAITRNPRDPSRSPGGSSAGSAAAVAAGEVELALGTQTLGSVLRPAAYCGIVGYKPTWGKIPTVGVAPCAPSLDTVGLFARDVTMLRRGAEALLALDGAPPPRTLRLGLALDYMQALIEPATRAAIERAVARLREAGIEVVELALPPFVEGSLPRALRLQAVETFMATGRWLAGKPIPPFVAGLLHEGSTLGPDAYRAERSWREEHRPRVAAIFGDRNLDALLAPNANLAPAFGTTGDPSPLAPWTFFGLPALALPIGDDPATRLPYSMQILGPYGADGALLEVAARLESALGTPETAGAARRS
ncbi:MAG: amidase [Candidatus Eremiobacteraeota bacterium]|nr:amidase [Candidatus Eremiobacteraeota bacterium]